MFVYIGWDRIHTYAEVDEMRARNKQRYLIATIQYGRGERKSGDVG
jgi:hypothetical protein